MTTFISLRQSDTCRPPQRTFHKPTNAPQSSSGSFHIIALAWRAFTAYFLIATVGAAFALNPSRHISQYGHTSWSVRDGALGELPTTLTQTADGYIWIGGSAGLVQFDGNHFQPWIPPVD